MQSHREIDLARPFRGQASIQLPIVGIRTHRYHTLDARSRRSLQRVLQYAFAMEALEVGVRINQINHTPRRKRSQTQTQNIFSQMLLI